MSTVSPRGLLDVERFVLPRQIVNDAIDVLAEAGSAGHECFLVLGGRLSPSRTALNVTSAIRPAQTPIRTRHGLLVHVDGRALFSVNQLLRRRGELLAAQIHSHPTDAYHSETDDHRPLATLLGAVSIVVPDFARHGFGSFDRWAWYRLHGPSDWRAFDPRGAVEVTD